MEPVTPNAPPALGVSGNIYLVGLMGAGKTSVGRALARHLGIAFFDTDQEIERATGVKIPVIFDIEGEAGFRARESKVFAELTQRRNIVLATGGGVVLSEHNRRLLAERGTVVYLRAAAADLAKRTRNDRNRPLLRTAEPWVVLQRLHEQRDPLYLEVAHLVVDTGTQSISTLVRKLAGQLATLGRSAASTA
jgi:shikimate kinase